MPLYRNYDDKFVNVTGDTMTGRLGQSVSGFHVATKDDITTRTDSGFFETNSATTGEGWPLTSNSWYHLISSTHSNDANYHAMQFAGDFFNNTDLFYRAVAGTGTTGWARIWNSANDGAGSGLDADLLDGQHGSFYAAATDVAMVLLTDSSASNSGSLTLDISSFTAYNDFKIFVRNVRPATANSDLQMTVSTDGGSTFHTTAGNYVWGTRYHIFGVAENQQSDTNATSIRPFGSIGLANTTGDASYTEITVWQPFGTLNHKRFSFLGIAAQHANNAHGDVHGGGVFQANTSTITHIRFTMTSGNLSGNFKLYGLL